MPTPRPPHWLIYLCALAALLYVASGRRGRVNAPPPPPPLPAAEQALLAQASPFDPTRLVKVKRHFGDVAGAAFSIADSGVWLTARRVVEGCGALAVVAGDSEGLPARVAPGPPDQVAVLTTHGGAPALPLAPGAPMVGSDAYDLGYPRGRPGEVATRYLGGRTLDLRARRLRTAEVRVWAEIGRTEGLHGNLTGLFGAPALDEAGRVTGVVLSEAPRRGRIYTTTPDEVARALAAAGVRPSVQASGVAVTRANYGLAGDDLRRTLRIAPVVCVRG
jgi:hypothetical protein